MSTTKPSPPGRDNPPPVQKVRIRYAKRGRLRFTSHRDFQRALERAVRRAGLPIAYSAGFSPHPKISYAGASPTGAASEAEYVEIGVTERVDLDRVRGDLDTALPDGLDVLEAVEAGQGALADRLEASEWRIELPGEPQEEIEKALDRLLAEESVEVERMTKNGRRRFEIRPSILRSSVVSSGSQPDHLTTHSSGSGEGWERYAILQVVVRHGNPTVRPDDVIAGLRQVSGLELDAVPRATRLAQGPWDEKTGTVGDPFEPDRDASVT